MIKLCTASAGAGKTHKLTGEYISLLFEQPKAYRHILAVTFTNKATDEMKQRILQELYALSVQGGKSEYLDDIKKQTSLSEGQIRQQAKKILVSILHDYSAFYISTIDKFFQMVMRSFARELGRMATYEVELDVDSVLSASIDKMFTDLEDADNAQLLEWLINFSLDEVDNGETWNIKGKIGKLCKEIFSENFKLIKNKSKADLSTAEVGELKNYLLQVVDSAQKQLLELVKQGLECMQESGLTVTDFKGGSRSPFTYFTKSANLKKGILVPADSFFKLPDNIDAWCKKSDLAKISGVYSSLNPIVSQICDFFSPYGLFCSYSTANAILDNVNILGILSDVYSRILEHCKEKNIILISESTELLNKLIDGSDTPFIYEKIGTTFNNYMLDEFQDTSQMQWNNFYPLISNSLDNGKYNLIVGDVKQSIYRWRGSNWNILAKQIKEQFREDQIVYDPLEENWRSGEEIINFNNSFFKYCAEAVQAKYSSEQGQIKEIYSKLEQKLPNKKKGTKGYVKVQFIPESDREFTEEALECLDLEIKDLLDRGYSLSDIAILVRKNKEGADVANFLMEKGYDVVSGDSLFISSSKAVVTVVNILRQLDNPDSGMLGVYKKYMNIPLVSNSKGDSLYQLCETIIRETLDDKQKQDIAFLQAFLDLVLTHTLKEGTNISEFLRWWDDVGVNKTISAPEDIDAIKIMTIHKSKGLAFGVTIIPFMKGALEHSNFTAPILWNEFSYISGGDSEKTVAVPVKYSSALQATQFAESYLSEKLSTYVDAINTEYVAFTRAKKELIVIAPEPEVKKDGTRAQKTVSDILFAYCEEKMDNNCYKIGEPLQAKHKGENISKFMVDNPFICAKHTDTMKSALGSGSVTEGETIREYGIAMHYVFSLITNSLCVEDAVKQAIDYGVADCTYDELLEMVNKALESVKEYDWFNPKYKVYNECTIINTDGNIKRPDRVITLNDCAIVVDYKFGTFNKDSLQLEGYKKQVRNYKNLLERMGFESVKGFLWYPLDNKILEI